jgi:hypothetical protein
MVYLEYSTISNITRTLGNVRAVGGLLRVVWRYTPERRAIHKLRRRQREVNIAIEGLVNPFLAKKLWIRTKNLGESVNLNLTEKLSQSNAEHSQPY